MKRSEIIAELRQYFGIDDLVCRHTYEAFGERAWMFLDSEYLETLLVVRRDILKTAMFCNNYNKAGSPRNFTQRGLRCNICALVSDKTKAGRIYLTAHGQGKAGDFDCKGLTAVQARHLIEDNAAVLPHPIRMEEGVTWLHIDTYDDGSGKKVSYFSV